MSFKANEVNGYKSIEFTDVNDSHLWVDQPEGMEGYFFFSTKGPDDEYPILIREEDRELLIDFLRTGKVPEVPDELVLFDGPTKVTVAYMDGSITISPEVVFLKQDNLVALRQFIDDMIRKHGIL